MQKEKLFKFNTPEFLDYNLEVVSFSGYEEMGELYSYEVDLISTNSEIDLDEMLQTDVLLQILHKNNKEDIYIHGILASFEVSDKINDYIHYKAHLVPKLWRLSMSPFNQIFLNKSITDIIEDILKQGNLTSSDYEFSLQESYDKKEYVCQYNETRYDFIKRWMQREGIYFYFQDGKDGCKLLITDDKSRHQEFPNDDKIPYRQASGLQSFQEQAISNLIYRSNTNPKSVRMKNFHYEKPSVNLDFRSNSSEQEYDEVYMFGNNIHTQSEIKNYTQINQQRYECDKKELLCSSNIIYIKPGYLYKLKDYFKVELNTTYLDTKVESTGSQRGFMSAGFKEDSNEASYYTNTFSMISSQTQYRMNADAPWPKVSGMISATIDGAGSGMTAELDKHGRYKVIMPFDLSGRKDAKASAYLRMAQPSAGEKQGIHFPLHKGTEVLIAFKGGDPDQPIITGAVPNVNTPSPVNESNVTKSVIQTHGGNIIHMEDTPGKAHIKMGIHDDLCSMVMHNDDGDEDGEYGIAWKTGGFWKVGSLDFSNTILGNKEESVVGGVEDIKLAEVFEVFAGWKQEIGLSDLFEAIKGTKRGVSPVSQDLRDTVVEVVVEKTTAVTLEKEDVNDDMTEVTENKVEITETMIDSAVKKYIDGLELAEVYDDKIATLAKSILTSENVTNIVDAHMENVVTKVDKATTHMKNMETRLIRVSTTIDNSTLKKSSAKINLLMSELGSIKNTLTVLD